MKVVYMHEAICGEADDTSIVFEVKPGQRIPIQGYFYDTNERGEPIIVLRAKSGKVKPSSNALF